MISECSGAIGKFREKSISINPQKTHMFTFTIHAYGMEGGNNYCAGKIVKIHVLSSGFIIQLSAINSLIFRGVSILLMKAGIHIKERKKGTLFMCLILKRWSTNWRQCKLKLTNQRKSNQILIFEERGKPEYPEKNLSVQSREPTNSIPYDARIKPGPHWWEAIALTTAQSLNKISVLVFNNREPY